jgi:hypothetical protein
MRILLALTLAGCTIGLPLTTAAVTGIHNAEVDHAADKWSYPLPLVVSAGVGALLDYFLFKGLQAQWSKPWS